MANPHVTDYDFKTIILHGSKNVPVKRTITPIENIHSKFNAATNSNSRGANINAAAIERKIESGEIGAPAVISRSDANVMLNARTTAKITRAQLAQKLSIPETIIRDIENGTIRLDSKTKAQIRTIARNIGNPTLSF